MVSRDAGRTQEQVINQLFAMTPTGELTRDMAETIDQQLEAKRRVGAITPILLYDLDGDGEVSKDEIERVRTVLSGRERSGLETMVLEGDTDKDGALSAVEIAQIGKAAAAKPQGRWSRSGLQGSQFMAFDANGDGVVEVEDIVKTIERIAAAGPPLTRSTQANSVKRCDLPKPSAKAIPIYVGGYEGTAISTVAVAGLDRETSFATLEIEEGDDPLYIVFNVYDPMVVRVTGATHRVERFVGGSLGGIGVVGLPKDVVDLTSLAACGIPAAYEMESSKGIQAKAILAANLGKQARMIGSYRLDKISLPSGESKTPAIDRGAAGSLTIQKGNRRFQMTEDGVKEIEAPGTMNALSARLLRYYPAGIASVMPQEVVTNGTAQTYDVLPQQAGLIQLVESGAMSVLRDGSYSIDKPIARFPAGLNGGHAVKFVLRRGVPMPAGSPGHSSVLIEETGKCVGGRC
jgi:hypothetical protein